jgi:membrane-bound ClpP family serine protease
MDWFIIISLLTLGWILLFIEIFIIPGITVLAVLGILMMLSGIYFAFYHFGSTVGWITASITIVLCSISLFAAMRSGFWKKLSLRQTISSRMNEEDLENVKIGDEALAISRIAPSGKALHAGQTREVHSTEGYIEENTKIEIVKISMNKIFVKPKS